MGRTVKNIQTDTCTRRSFKFWLIILASILLILGVRVGLTRAGIIPNRFDIELLCSNSKNIGENSSIIQGKQELDISQEYIGNDLDVDGFIPNLSLPKDRKPKDITPIMEKPIIYFYPTEQTKIHIKLGIPENLLHTYPKYNSEKGRNVIAQPNGDLEDIETGRKLYALYREGKSYNETNFDEGFVVAGKDIIPFLGEKLAILGLNEREAEEFIVYWLPQMENNEWNLIRFETIEEQNENMPLNITPRPDTVIRIMMDWKAVDESINIPEQELTTPKRNGFTVVEWGGSTRN